MKVKKMALNAQNKKGLSGYTLSSDYALAMLDWRDEKKRRQDALDDLSPYQMKPAKSL